VRARRNIWGALGPNSGVLRGRLVNDARSTPDNDCGSVRRA
jgi:hypothetical protein